MKISLRLIKEFVTFTAPCEKTELESCCMHYMFIQCQNVH